MAPRLPGEWVKWKKWDKMVALKRLTHCRLIVVEVEPGALAD